MLVRLEKPVTFVGSCSKASCSRAGTFHHNFSIDIYLFIKNDLFIQVGAMNWRYYYSANGANDLEKRGQMYTIDLKTLTSHAKKIFQARFGRHCATGRLTGSRLLVENLWTSRLGFLTCSLSCEIFWQSNCQWCTVWRLWLATKTPHQNHEDLSILVEYSILIGEYLPLKTRFSTEVKILVRLCMSLGLNTIDFTRADTDCLQSCTAFFHN